MTDLPASDWVSGGGSRAPTNNMHTTVQDPYATETDR